MNILQKLYLSYLKRTDTIKWARKLGVKIGDNCRLLSVTFSTEPYLIEIGNMYLQRMFILKRMMGEFGYLGTSTLNGILLKKLKFVTMFILVLVQLFYQV
jgi:hypothetical protein